MLHPVDPRQQTVPRTALREQWSRDRPRRSTLDDVFRRIDENLDEL